MHKKGVEFEPEVRVYEICNPIKAKAVLLEDIDLASTLPCRISIYEKEGETYIAMINPTAILKMLNPSEQLQAIAQEVVKISLDIMHSIK